MLGLKLIHVSKRGHEIVAAVTATTVTSIDELRTGTLQNANMKALLLDLNQHVHVDPLIKSSKMYLKSNPYFAEVNELISSKNDDTA